MSGSFSSAAGRKYSDAGRDHSDPLDKMNKNEYDNIRFNFQERRMVYGNITRAKFIRRPNRFIAEVEIDGH